MGFIIIEIIKLNGYALFAINYFKQLFKTFKNENMLSDPSIDIKLYNNIVIKEFPGSIIPLDTRRIMPIICDVTDEPHTKEIIDETESQLISGLSFDDYRTKHEYLKLFIHFVIGDNIIPELFNKYNLLTLVNKTIVIFPQDTNYSEFNGNVILSLASIYIFLQYVKNNLTDLTILNEMYSTKKDIFKFYSELNGTYLQTIAVEIINYMT